MSGIAGARVVVPMGRRFRWTDGVLVGVIAAAIPTVSSTRAA